MARAKIKDFDPELVGLAAIGKALGHPARIEILRYLAANGELPCMAIVDHLPLSQPASSRHINELLRAGLLQSRVDRTKIFFSVRSKAIDDFCVMTHDTLHSKSAKSTKSTKSAKSDKSAKSTNSTKSMESTHSDHARQSSKPRKEIRDLRLGY